MNKKILFYLVIGIIIYFSICFNVFAKDSLYGTYNAFGLASSEIKLTTKNYQSFKDYFNNYIEKNGKEEYTYLLIRSNDSFYYLVGGVFNLESTFLKPNYTINEEVVEKYSFSIVFNENDVKINYVFRSSERFDDVLSFYFYNYFTSSTYLVWSNKQLNTNVQIDESKTYYYYNFLMSDDLKKYYNFEKLSINQPIYTYTNLLFGDYEVKPPEKVNYKIEYYFDDVLSPDKTEFKSGFENDLVTEFTDYSTDLYKLFTEDKEYKLILSKEENLNVLKIYYRSPLYGTLKQPVDTSQSKIYLFFHFSDIKDMFPNVKFENFTQFEQLVIVGLFNLLYCVFIFFCVWILLKASYKCWSWILGFVT